MKDRLRPWLRQLFSTEGFRGPVLTLLSGSTVVMALAYLSQPILTRLYTPEEFGLSDYFVAVMVVLISFTSLRYEDALMLPEDEEEAAGVFWLALAVLACFAAGAGVLLLWRAEIAALAGLPDLAPWLLLVPPTLLAMRGAKVANLWLIRGRRFRAVSTGQVAGTMVMVGGRVGTGLPPVDAGTGGLIGGFCAGHAVSLLVLGRAVLRQSGPLLLGACRWPRIREAALRYRRFPLFLRPPRSWAPSSAGCPCSCCPCISTPPWWGSSGAPSTSSPSPSAWWAARWPRFSSCTPPRPTATTGWRRSPTSCTAAW